MQDSEVLPNKVGGHDKQDLTKTWCRECIVLVPRVTGLHIGGGMAAVASSAPRTCRRKRRGVEKNGTKVARGGNKR